MVAIALSLRCVLPFFHCPKKCVAIFGLDHPLYTLTALGNDCINQPNCFIILMYRMLALF